MTVTLTLVVGGSKRNKSQNFAVNIFEVTKFSTKHIFDEMSCIDARDPVSILGWGKKISKIFTRYNENSKMHGIFFIYNKAILFFAQTGK